MFLEQAQSIRGFAAAIARMGGFKRRTAASCPINMNTTILGFQLRLSPDQLNEWDKKRRETFLLREDIAKPLSVDEDIWPLLDDAKIRNDLFLNPEFPVNGLNIHDLRPGISTPPGRGCLLAITASDIEVSQLRSRHRIQSELLCRDPKELGLRLLGFDVADAWFYSAQSNCGFGDSKQSLSQRFSHSINGYGLFDSQEEAAAFREGANVRIPDHAPFVVYGLWAAAEHD